MTNADDRLLIADFLPIQAISAEARVENSVTQARGYLSKAGQHHGDRRAGGTVDLVPLPPLRLGGQLSVGLPESLLLRGPDATAALSPL